jgi:MYXO-CTERM domain-containing protein
VAIALAAGARADTIYQLENLAAGSAHEFFNNSQGTETEDCWVANSFTAAAGATHITQLQFLVGSALTNQPVTFMLYNGTSLTNPTGLSRIVASTTTTTVTSATNTFVTLNFGSPIDLPVGQVFYAAMLMPSVPGSLFPYSSDALSAGSPAPLGRSFFDVGATQGAPYNLDVTTGATVLGGNHPVVSFAQDPGNLAVRVVATPEPGVLGLGGLGLLVLARRRR